MRPPVQSSVSPPPRGLIADDLFCLDCGYNLRGLSGETIRCPECGVANSAELLEYPAERIRAYVRTLESNLSLGVLVLLGCLPLLYFCATQPRAEIIAALAVLSAIWAGLIGNFRRLCKRRTNWRRGIVRYQLVALLAWAS